MKKPMILLFLLLVLASCSKDGADVRLEWFNPRTGESMPAVEAAVDGSLVLPQKPDTEDWTLTILHK